MPEKNIVLLHGWGADSTRFEPFVKRLKELNLYPLAPDLPGFGEEPPPREVWGVGDYARWLADKLRSMDVEGPIILLGHSFGGQVAIKFAHDYPEMVKKLILISPAGVRFKRSFKGWILASLAELFKFVFSLPGLRTFYEFARWALYRLLRQKDYYKASGIMRRIMSKILREDLRPIFGEIKLPTLLVWGTDDVFTPYRLHKYYLESFPDIRFKSYAGKGHNFFYLEVDDLIEDIKEFLES